MLCGVATVIFDVVVNMVRSIVSQKRILPLLVMAGAFTAVRFFSVNIILIILICGVIGAIDTYRREKAQKEGGQL